MDKGDDRKIYEIGYLLVPYLSTRDASLGEAGGPGDVTGVVESSIKTKIKTLGGEITSEMEPSMTRLAYIITKVINNKHTKFSDGYFGALRFKLVPDEAVKFDKELTKDDMVIRHLMISLPAGSENIVVPRRSFAPRREDKPFEIERIMPEKEDDKTVMTVEELDKEIDKLVEEPA